MPGIKGHPNIIAMRGRRKGGAHAPQIIHHQGIAAHAEEFLGHLQFRAYSSASIDGHRWALRQFIDWTATVEKPEAASFTRVDLAAYQGFLHQYRNPHSGRALAINTQLGRLGCVRRFFAWLCRNGIIPANPAADLDLPRKQTRQLPKTLNAVELERLFETPDTQDSLGLRDRAILELFYATGIRRSEMTNLDVGDYDPSNQTLTIRQGKGGKSRMLPIGARAATWLDRFLTDSRPHFAHLPGESALFLSGYGTRITSAYLGNWVKKLMIQCGIDKPGSCHLFRHSCATDMHRGGADIRYVQEMLGHTRMETTQIYTHVHIDALRDVHTRCHPHGRNPQEADEAADGVKPQASENRDEAEEKASQAPIEPLSPQSMPAGVTSPFSESCACSHTSETPLASTPGIAPLGDDPPDEESGGLARMPPKKPVPGPASDGKTAVQKDKKPTGNQQFSRHVTYYGYRYYDPVTGRWPSRDPIEEEGGINLFAFVRNNAVNTSDVFGLRPYDTYDEAKNTLLTILRARQEASITAGRAEHLAAYGQLWHKAKPIRRRNSLVAIRKDLPHLLSGKGHVLVFVAGKEFGGHVYCYENNGKKLFDYSNIMEGPIPTIEQASAGTYGFIPFGNDGQGNPYSTYTYYYNNLYAPEHLRQAQSLRLLLHVHTHPRSWHLSIDGRRGLSPHENRNPYTPSLNDRNVARDANSVTAGTPEFAILAPDGTTVFYEPAETPK